MTRATTLSTIKIAPPAPLFDLFHFVSQYGTKKFQSWQVPLKLFFIFIFWFLFLIKVVRVVRYPLQYKGYIVLKWCDIGAILVRVMRIASWNYCWLGFLSFPEEVDFLFQSLHHTREKLHPPWRSQLLSLRHPYIYL